MWFAPSLCSRQRSVLSWKPFPTLALLWGSWSGSSLSSPPSFPENREATGFEFILHSNFWKMRTNEWNNIYLKDQMTARYIKKWWSWTHPPPLLIGVIQNCDPITRANAQATYTVIFFSLTITSWNWCKYLHLSNLLEVEVVFLYGLEAVESQVIVGMGECTLTLLKGWHSSFWI